MPSKVNLDVLTFYDFLIHRIDQVNNRLAVLKHTVTLDKNIKTKEFRTRLKVLNQALRPLTKSSRRTASILPVTVKIPTSISSKCKKLYTEINTKSKEFLKKKITAKHYSRVLKHTISQFKLLQKQLKKRCLQPYTL